MCRRWCCSPWVSLVEGGGKTVKNCCQGVLVVFFGDKTLKNLIFFLVYYTKFNLVTILISASLGFSIVTVTLSDWWFTDTVQSLPGSLVLWRSILHCLAERRQKCGIWQSFFENAVSTFSFFSAAHPATIFGQGLIDYMQHAHEKIEMPTIADRREGH